MVMWYCYYGKNIIQSTVSTAVEEEIAARNVKADHRVWASELVDIVFSA